MSQNTSYGSPLEGERHWIDWKFPKMIKIDQDDDFTMYVALYLKVSINILPTKHCIPQIFLLQH